MTRGATRGFTLIELMLVAAIIGLLAAIAVPKFGNLILKAQESVVKGHLGALRSALAIYYADTEGLLPVYPTVGPAPGSYGSEGGGSVPLLLSSLELGKKYIDEIPSIKIPGYHTRTWQYKVLAVWGYSAPWFYFGTSLGDNPSRYAMWVYFCDSNPWFGNEKYWGRVGVWCAEKDTRGIPWSDN